MSTKSKLQRGIGMLGAFLVAFTFASNRADATPVDVIKVLQSSSSAILYSLEPWSQPAAGEPTLHGFKILGKARIDAASYGSAAAQFTLALRSDADMAACFDPRHAIALVSDGHKFDFLLCYACHQMVVYRDNALVATLAVAGSPKVLNSLLVAANLPVSTSYDEDAELAQVALSRQAEQRWRDAMPRALAILPEARSPFLDADAIMRMAIVLAKEYPSSAQRVLALYAWYGAGAGPWSGFPSYESIAEQLLMTHSTDELLAPLDSAQLSSVQLEGAARLFGAWTFPHERPGDLKRLSDGLRRRLLTQAQSSEDQDKLERARQAFGSP
ncbi:MAG: hypothetical protein V4582_09625 [Pseudomonadota bacterium]